MLLLRWTRCILSAKGEPKTPTVARVEFDVEDAQPSRFGKPLDLFQLIIGQMFVTDRVEAVGIEHRRQVTLLQHPNAIGR